ncbi:hypothetical protein [Microbacterium sp. MYb62]|uniref:hypothetical protein n=1 Tax=Microbacterium sp. MYb62 TaxID=1848690 RepID=UPI000CFC9BA2|nr:hypothetical protein [Microbacterium sp. MYb62]PRB14446.1 hypothetical protein CQ042_11035 [Microbacterium sp. MYb62]
MVDLPLKPLGPRPRLGRAALITVVAMWALVLFFTFSGGLVGGAFASVAARVLGVGSYLIGAGLAIASLVRRERKRPAIVTLCLLIGGPVLFFALGMMVWFTYGLGIS